jgi:uncharacterized protein involved in exopolysaccharide biosynthesis
LFAGKWIILACVVASVAVAVGYYLRATPWYSAQVTLLPAEAKSSTGMAGQVSSLTGALGLRSMISSSTKPEPLAVLRSRDFAERFISERNLESVLRPQVSHGLFNRGTPPDSRSVTSFFLRKVIAVMEDRKTGLVVLEVSWVDADLAAEWANALALQINAQMRANALAEAESNAKYLREEMAAASQVAIQQALGRLMQDQLENLLLARGNTEFAFRVIDRAHAPLGPVSPQPLPLLLAAVAFGFILSLAIVLYRSRFLLAGG